jgi:O-glycosyl hydrolase
MLATIFLTLFSGFMSSQSTFIERYFVNIPVNIPDRFMTLAAAIVSSLGMACVSLAMPPVRVLLTRVDDGDAKRAALESGGNWKYDIHQDDDFTLLRSETILSETSNAAGSITINIDRNKTYQTMLGYGGAMTDASAFVLMNLKTKNPELYAYTMKKLFSPTDGAGFSFLRLAMGASDYIAAKSYYTYCDEASPTLNSFSIDRDKQFIIPALKDAIKLNPQIKLLATPWSAPAWMKTNGSLLGISSADKANGATCRLRPDCFAVYADYFVKFIEAYQAQGIPIFAVTLQNEPQNDASDYPCMRMNTQDQIKLIDLLRPKLAAKRLATKILVHDHNWVLHPNDRRVVGGDAKAAPVESVSRILSDPVAGKYVYGSAWHCYSGSVDDMKRVYGRIHSDFPESHILTTELSGWGKNRGNWWGDVEWGMAHDWLGPELNGSEASLEWNIALDDQSGPTLRHNSEAMGIVTVKTDEYQSVKFEREFYAMAQMSRAARPRAVRIGSSIQSGSGNGLDTIAFALPDGHASLVVFNRNRQDAAFQLKDRQDRFSYRLAGHSIGTFVW